MAPRVGYVCGREQAVGRGNDARRAELDERGRDRRQVRRALRVRLRTPCASGRLGVGCVAPVAELWKDEARRTRLARGLNAHHAEARGFSQSGGGQRRGGSNLPVDEDARRGAAGR